MSIIKLSVVYQQDVEDESTLPEPPSVPEVIPSPIVKPTDGAPIAASHVADDAEGSRPSRPYLLYASVVFFMLTVPCAFYICGGARWLLLRRLIHRARAGGYRRVNVDDDMEK
ncbi:hypothetical protein OG21DRAFT_1514603 [Imleria badia]|nr:hypothetical protein OG21DRAFT_1514603 [Imleria badia]